MERSMCRSSRMAGALAQLSIIGPAAGANDRGQVHTRRTSAVRADEAPVGLFSALVDLPVDECCSPGLSVRRGGHRIGVQPRSPHLHRDPLLTINATDYTNSVKHHLNWGFTHFPSSGGVRAVDFSRKGFRPAGIRPRTVPGLPARSAGRRGRCRCPGPAVGACAHGGPCSRTGPGCQPPAP